MGPTIDVEITSGIVRGTRERGVGCWRSIPYAAPPIGELRLRAPQPVPPWSGVLDTTRFGNAAIQAQSTIQIGPRTTQSVDEDALTLNVTVPLRPATAPRPVMVFIHGGANVCGSSAIPLYSGRQLAARGDLIVVSMNYRLGVFGFGDFSRYSTAERTFDSNCGLRDQVAALEWVQRNIVAFGGDPDNVTVFGQSSGGAAVLTLMATPAAEGLFQAAIAESAPADWAHSPRAAEAFAAQCIEALGATEETAAETLANCDPDRLHRAGTTAARSVAADRPGYTPMVPTVDGSYLPTFPIAALTGGTAHRVPLIIGTNRDEGTLFAQPNKPNDEMPMSPPLIDTYFEGADPDVKAQVLAAYPGYPEPKVAINLGGDATFLRPSLAACEGHSAYAPTYHYRYDFAQKRMQRAGFGATHDSELVAVFGVDEGLFSRALAVVGGRRGQRLVTEQVQSQWISFARHGRPLPSWPQYTTQTRRTLVFDSRTRVAEDLDRERRVAWSAVTGPHEVSVSPMDSPTR